MRPTGWAPKAEDPDQRDRRIFRFLLPAFAGLLAAAVLFQASVPGPPAQAGRPSELSSPNPPGTFERMPQGAALDTLEFAGHLGGTTNAVFLQGDYLLAGMGSHLKVLDITDPTGFSIAGSLRTPQIVQFIYAAGGMAFVRAGALLVVDLAQPESPAIVGSLPGERVEAFEGGRAYVRAGSQLSVFELSDPAAPVLLGSYPVGGQQIAVEGGILYLLEQDGLRMIDLADPSGPAQIGFYSPGEQSFDLLAVDGVHAFLVWGEMAGQGIYTCPDIQGEIWRVNLADPANPDVVAVLTLNVFPEQLWLKDHTLFFNYTDCFWAHEAIYINGMGVVDVSAPDLLPGATYYWSTAEDAAGSSDKTYFARGDQGLFADQSFGAVETAPGSLVAVAAGGSHAILADVRNILWTIDLRKLPELIASPSTLGTEAHDLVIEGDYLYAAGGFCDVGRSSFCSGGLRVFDLTDPLNPGWIATSEEWGIAQAVAVDEGFAYLTYGDCALEPCASGHRVIDISDPSNPSVVGEFATDRIAGGVALSGSLAFVADGDQGLQIIDITLPAAPVEVGAHDTPGFASDVAVAGDYAYLADGAGGFRVLDVSTPAAPVEIGSLAGAFLQVAVHGKYAYSGGQVIDISDPTAPVPVAAYDFDADLALARSFAILAAEGEGVYLYRNGYSISGGLWHANLQPAAGISVTSGTDPGAATGPNGRYSLDNLPAGAYQVDLPGYGAWPPSTGVTLPPDAWGTNLVVLPPPVASTLIPGVPAQMVLTDTQGLATTLGFPAGAVTATTAITLTPRFYPFGDSGAFAAHAFDLAAAQSGMLRPELSFSAPVNLTLHYSDDDVRTVADEAKLAVSWWDGEHWQPAEQTCDPPGDFDLDVANNVIQVGLCRGGSFSLFGPTNRVFYPLIVVEP